jgi:HD-like signal output (HDOD) protein
MSPKGLPVGSAPREEIMVQTAFSAGDLEVLLTVGPLPGMPQTAVRLVGLSRDPSSGPNEFAVLIEADPGLAVQVLRFVNSSYFGFRCQISSVKQAAALLGIRAIKNFVLWQAIFSVIPNPRCCLFDLKTLWRDSLRRALFARGLSKLLGVPDAEEAFAAGLLQDMAIPLLARSAPEEYSKLFYARFASKHRARLSQLEEHVFGWNHAMAAGVVARKWQLPETLAALIQHHVVVEQPPCQSQDDLGRLAVAMSALLPADDDVTWMERSRLEEAYAQVRPPEGPSTEDLLRKVDAEFTDIAPLLQVSPPRISLVEKYHKAVAAGSEARG